MRRALTLLLLLCGLCHDADAAGSGIHGIKEVYNVKDYGALGNGATDDTNAINAAINASRGTSLGVGNFPAGETGGIIHFPAGRYRTTAPIEVHEGVVLQGAGMFASTIHQSATDGSHAIVVTTSWRSGAECFQGIRDLHILGNTASGDGIHVEASETKIIGYAYYDHVFIDKHGGDGIYIELYAIGGTWNHIYSYDNRGDGLDCEVGTQATVQSFHNCHFRVNSGVGVKAGGLGWSFTGRNVIESNVGIGMIVRGQNGSYAGLYFENNHRTTPTNGTLWSTPESVQMAVYGRNNDFYSTFVNGGDGIIQIKPGANNNHFFNAHLANNAGGTNFQIDAGATLNRLIFTHDTSGEELVLDNQGNGANVVLDQNLWGVTGNLTVGGDILAHGGEIYTNRSNASLRLSGATEDAGGVITLYGSNHATKANVIETKGDIWPDAHDTYYLGRNDDDTPLAYRGLILADTANGKHYRIECINGVVRATDLTE